MEESHVEYDPEHDARWLGNVAQWYGEWFPLIRLLLARAGRPSVAWFFTSPHYFGFMLRWATWLRWPLQIVIPLQDGEHAEMLVMFSDFKIGDVAHLMSATKAALAKNTYGPRKSVEMLRELIDLSPPGTVYDPFCGASASSLVAGIHAGRRVVGYEIDEALAPQAAESLRVAESALATCLSAPK